MYDECRDGIIVIQTIDRRFFYGISLLGRFDFLAFAVEAMFIFYRRQVDSDYDKKGDKACRKDFHKKTLELCGIKNYLGRRDYQIVKTCLDARDSIAHGDFFISDFEFTPTVADDHNIFSGEILTQSSEQFRNITLRILEEGINAAKRIDDIYMIMVIK
ncbi:Uncharacterised protein [Salmonella enterica subsp. arizonae]|nr:Uncharacterised protein [Salmonella enterica subsp. arizonae]